MIKDTKEWKKEINVRGFFRQFIRDFRNVDYVGGIGSILWWSFRDYEDFRSVTPGDDKFKLRFKKYDNQHFFVLEFRVKTGDDIYEYDDFSLYLNLDKFTVEQSNDKSFVTWDDELKTTVNDVFFKLMEKNFPTHPKTLAHKFGL